MGCRYSRNVDILSGYTLRGNEMDHPVSTASPNYVVNLYVIVNANVMADITFEVSATYIGRQIATSIKSNTTLG